MRLLLTGAGGFVGAHVLRHVLTETDWDVVATDSFRHKGKTDRIVQTVSGIPGWRDRVTVVTHDLAAPMTWQMEQRLGPVDYLVAMASASHVDRSIADPAGFIRNNTDVALSTFETARHLRPSHVILISTDEVYGPVERDSAGHPEWAPILPSNPYSASKAAQEAIAISYWRTYGMPLTITNTMNMIGEMQDAEKYQPMLVKRISAGDTVTIHGREHGGVTEFGSRHYLHARNLADALLFLLREGPPPAFPEAERPARYNITGLEQLDNFELADMVAGIVGKPLRYEVVDYHSTRPGHDPHYGLDATKIAAAGWKPPVPFAESLERTVRWTLAHPEWLQS